jgi:hypothetical protein
MSNKLLDLNGLSYFKLQQDAYNANTYAAASDIPTKTSDLTNDSGFITASSLPTVNDATLTITQNGTTVATFSANSATNTSAAITVPTVVSDLTNDADYQSGSQVSSAIATAIAGITGISFEIVQSLPATGDPGTIYLVSHGGSGTDIYDEYVYVNNSWEKLGTTSADFTDVAYYDSVNNTLSANSSMFWEIATNADIATLFA